MIDMTNFKKSVKWYDENLATLLPQYRGKYVGVCIDKVCGSWDDQDVGFGDMVAAGYTPGDFIVQLCVPREEEVCFHCPSGELAPLNPERAAEYVRATAVYAQGSLPCKVFSLSPLTQYILAPRIP